MRDPNTIAQEIFKGASCQKDIDARIGDFAFAVEREGIKIIGRGGAWYNFGQPSIYGWHFIYPGTTKP
jgi:hypothetical protein